MLNRSWRRGNLDGGLRTILDSEGGVSQFAEYFMGAGDSLAESGATEMAAGRSADYSTSRRTEGPAVEAVRGSEYTHCLPVDMKRRWYR